MSVKKTELVDLMKQWQKIEDASVRNTTDIIKNTNNPLIHVVMEIIRQDSVMHRRVQQLIIDFYDKQSLDINSDEISELWDKLKEHDDIEKKTIELAKQALKDTKSDVVKYLVEYLLTDELKHDNLISQLENLK